MSIGCRYHWAAYTVIFARRCNPLFRYIAPGFQQRHADSTAYFNRSETSMASLTSLLHVPTCPSLMPSFSVTFPVLISCLSFLIVPEVAAGCLLEPGLNGYLEALMCWQQRR